MWLKTQKVLRFIPGINLVSVVAWIISAAKKKLRISYFVKNLVLMAALMVFAFMIGRGLKSFTANEVFSVVLFYVSLALYTYICAFISVNEQENIQNGKYENK